MSMKPQQESRAYPRQTWIDGWSVHKEQWSALLSHVVQPCVIEVGAWMGKTSVWLLQEFPGLYLVAIDKWEATGFWGARINRAVREGWIDQPVNPIAQYKRNIGSYSDRVQTIQADSIEGLKMARDYKPDVVYIDADHRYESVLMDVRTATDLFPDAVICGDDYEDDGPTFVKRAVHEIADDLDLCVKVCGRWWQYERD